MKKIEKYILVCFISIFILSALGIHPVYANNTGSFTTSKASKTSIKLNKTKITIYKGKTATLKAKVTGSSSKVKWKSSNSSIAAVNSKGKITAKKAGNCKITATVNGRKTTCIITVKNDLSLFKKEFPKASWWSKSWKYSFHVSGNKIVIGNTYGKIVKKYKINYVQKTSYGYFINIAGYNNYRWYRSNPHTLECYLSANGTRGRNNGETGIFHAFGC